MAAFLGAGFMIGSNGYALTAAHVLDVTLSTNQGILGMLVDKVTNRWLGFTFSIVDIHPTEDIALLQIPEAGWKESGIRVSFEKQFSSFQYKLFGYPSANLLEDVDVRDAMGQVLGRPDLIYSSGHIRRRTTFTLPSIRGKSFYELSQPAGRGCSGSPVFRVSGNIWDVVGIYVADRIVNIPFETYDKDLNWKLTTLELPEGMGYAVRMDAASDWTPMGLTCALDKIP